MVCSLFSGCSLQLSGLPINLWPVQSGFWSGNCFLSVPHRSCVLIVDRGLIVNLFISLNAIFDEVAGYRLHRRWASMVDNCERSFTIWKSRDKSMLNYAAAFKAILPFAGGGIALLAIPFLVLFLVNRRRRIHREAEFEFERRKSRSRKSPRLPNE
jgi:hypothetical protein